MKDFKTWNTISKHISGEETLEEKNIFIEWLNENESNKILFNKINNSFLRLFWLFENHKMSKKGQKTQKKRHTVTTYGEVKKEPFFEYLAIPPKKRRFSTFYVFVKHYMQHKNILIAIMKILCCWNSLILPGVDNWEIILKQDSIFL